MLSRTQNIVPEKGIVGVVGLYKDLYKEGTTHCGIPNTYNNRSKVQKKSIQYRIHVNGTTYVK